MKILVCGGRAYKNTSAVFHSLQTLHARRVITIIIEGGAFGADRLARQWALENGIPVETYEADWRHHGNGAGPRRNAKMLAEGKPDGVVAFPGGVGTLDMIDKAERAGVKVWRTGGWPS